MVFIGTVPVSAPQLPHTHRTTHSAAMSLRGCRLCVPFKGYQSGTNHIKTKSRRVLKCECLVAKEWVTVQTRAALKWKPKVPMNTHVGRRRDNLKPRKGNKEGTNSRKYKVKYIKRRKVAERTKRKEKKTKGAQRRADWK